MAFPTSPTNGQQANINGITYTYSNTVTAWTVSTSVSNTFVSINVSGNVNSGNVLATGLASVTGNITGGNLSGTSIVGTLTTAAQTNITSVGTLGSLTVTANTTSGNLLTGGLISATGNITGGNILGGANVNATTHTGTTVSVTANVTGGNILTGGLISAAGNISANNATFTSNQTLSYGTANGVIYLNGSKVLTTGSGLVFDGTNLGVGTSSPASRLHVKSTVNDSTNGLTLEYNAGTAYYGRIFSSGNDLTISADTGNTGGTMRLLTGGTERARFDTSGNFLVGDTTTIGTGGKLQVKSSTDTSIFKCTAATTYAAIVSNVENTAARLIAFQYGSGASPTNVGRITTDGTNIALATVSGITFPATQSASADANTLDDYEEGSCTLVLSDSSGNNATMGSSNVFRYIKIGRMVSVSGTLSWDSVTGVTTSRTRITGLPFTASSVNPMRWPAVNGSSSINSFNITRSEIGFGLDFNNAFIWGTRISGNNLDNNMVITDFGSSGTLYGLQITYFTEN